jgi:hypothetical protein
MAVQRNHVPPRKTVTGKPIVDATEPLVTYVKKVDLRNAQKGDPLNCAHAKALTRQEDAQSVHVYRSKILIEYPDKVVRYQTPNRIREDTIAFDRGAPRKFMEGEYTLYPPSKSQRLGADKRKSTRGGGKDKRRRQQKRRPKLKGVRPRAPALF